MKHNRVSFSLTTVVLALIGIALLDGSALASKGHAMKVRGEVVAINVIDTPNVIVLRSTTARNQEMIVGATVQSDVKIMRRTQRVNLGDIQIGDSVDLVYVKTAEGLTARSIHVR